MDDKLIQKIILELEMSRLLKRIEYQMENPIKCLHKTSFICRQCIYNVGDTEPICTKTE